MVYLEEIEGESRMIKLGLDCPTKWLEQVQPLGDYDWVMADFVLTNKEYADYYAESKRFKILNNRKRATGVPIGASKIWEALQKIEADLIVAPDWYLDNGRTLKAYMEFVKEFGEDAVIGVIQGKEDKEIGKCLDTYGGIVAVPYDVGVAHEVPLDEKIEAREKVVNWVLEEGRAVHLLGVLSVKEFGLYDMGKDVTLSTGLPVYLGLEGRRLEDFKDNRDWATYILMGERDFEPTVFKLVKENIEVLRRMMV